MYVNVYKKKAFIYLNPESNVTCEQRNIMFRDYCACH